jgi:hypothetical protein
MRLLRLRCVLTATSHGNLAKEAEEFCMSSLKKLIAAGIIGTSIAAPATAQYQPYPQDQQSYPQQYPEDQQGYPQEDQSYPPDEQSNPQYQQYPQAYPNYGYGQDYNDPVGAMIDQLLGGDYDVADRAAVRQCAIAAMAQAQGQYEGYSGYNSDPQYDRYGTNFRVTAITGIDRRPGGVRVRGRLSTGYGSDYRGSYGEYRQGYNREDLSFRCNVDYRGAVTNVRVDQSDDEND